MIVAKRPGKIRWYDSSHRIENIIRPGAGIRKIIPKSSDHPTAKPPELAAHFIGLHTQPGDLVVDPFSGGGSTLVAAIRTGRKAIGIELSERWCRKTVQAIEAERTRLAQDGPDTVRAGQDRGRPQTASARARTGAHGAI